MKQFLIITFLGWIPLISFSQSLEKENEFGFAINSSFNGEIYPIRIVPSIIYFNENNQFEIGFGFNPSNRQNQKLLSTEINYKYFPNGHSRKFNMFLITSLSYIHSKKNSFYPSNFNYLFVNGGYGFEIVPFKNAFIGTNISLGAFTYDKKSEIPYYAFKSEKLFHEIGLSLSFQFSVGYRL